jgi:hypothetical protein
LDHLFDYAVHQDGDSHPVPRGFPSSNAVVPPVDDQSRLARVASADPTHAVRKSVANVHDFYVRVPEPESPVPTHPVRRPCR